MRHRNAVDLIASQSAARHEMLMASSRGRVRLPVYLDGPVTECVQMVPPRPTARSATRNAVLYARGLTARRHPICRQWQSALYAKGLPVEVRLKAVTLS